MTGLIKPEEALLRLQRVPYACGGGAWDGSDCWGIVELWYRHVLGIELDDRGAIAPGHAGIAAGVEAMADWQWCDAPQDHCLVLMRQRRFQYGHVGIFWHGSVLHSDEHTGCVFEPLSRRHIHPRITGYLIRK